MAIGSLSLYLLSFIILLADAFIFGSISNLFSFLPYEVITKTQIWRLFLSFLFNSSIQSFLLSFIFTQNLLAEREKAQGTALFLIELIIKTFIINSIITLFYFIEMKTYLFFYIHTSHGLWNMFFYMSTIKCYLKPYQETKLFFFNLKIVNKQIPFIMNLIFILLIDPVGPIVSTSLGLLDAFTVKYLIKIFIQNNIKTQVQQKFLLLTLQHKDHLVDLITYKKLKIVFVTLSQTNLILLEIVKQHILKILFKYFYQISIQYRKIYIIINNHKMKILIMDQNYHKHKNKFQMLIRCQLIHNNNNNQKDNNNNNNQKDNNNNNQKDNNNNNNNNNKMDNDVQIQLRIITI